MERAKDFMCNPSINSHNALGTSIVYIFLNKRKKSQRH